jgi:hypothetical protein
MIIKLPRMLRYDAISKFTSRIVGNGGNPAANDVTLDFSDLQFIDGSGYTVLSNCMEWMLSKGVIVRIRYFDNINNHAIQYLDDCGFFARYAKSPLRSFARVRPTTLPCTPVEQTRAFGWIEYTLSPWLEATLGASKPQLASVRAAVKEAINNIGDHSTINTGFVHAQHYPNIRCIKITISDFGAGIPATIRRQYGDMSDDAAIIHATKEGTTARSKPNNMGAGLNYLVDVTLANRGAVRFHSLSGNVTCVCGKRGERTYENRRGTGHYPGTLLEIELDTRLFVGDEDDERGDFEW